VDRPTTAAQPAPHPTHAPRPFRPAWWLPGRHAQTIGGRLLRLGRSFPLRRERIETRDGDFLDLDFAPAPREGAPQVLLLHGLEGSARRGYALITYAELAAAGIQGVGLNFRSCSGEPNRLARLYHSGETGDLRFVLDHLAARFPGVRRGAIGFSLGGNVLLKLLGEEGEGAREWLEAAAAISVPYDLAAGADHLERSAMGRFYRRRFVRSLQRKIAAKRALLAGKVDLARALRARTFREFDDVATAPLHGFADAAEYYRLSSSARYLERVRVPTLLLHAEDDPFLPPHALPRDAIARNPHLVPVITPRGGHVGFIGGPPWAPRFWAEAEAVRFLAARLAGGAP
jgi:predicted alpha/beta-fold hydrolase